MVSSSPFCLLCHLCLSFIKHPVVKMDGSRGAQQPPTPFQVYVASHPATVHTFSTQLSGALATAAFYPIDVVKIRFMSQDGTTQRLHNKRYYTSTFASMRLIYREEGARALVKGLHVAIIGTIVAWGSYMLIYRYFEKTLGDHFAGRATVSCCASSFSALTSNPFWLIKTRMQIEEVHKESTKYYSSAIGGLRHVVKADGVRALWRGISAQLLLGLPQALNFPIYDTLKELRLRMTGRRRLDMWEVCLCSAFSKAIVSSIAHPLFLVKTRLMDQRGREGSVVYCTLVGTFVTTVRREGCLGMFRGLAPALQQAVPRSVLQFMLYELTLQTITGHRRWGL